MWHGPALSAAAVAEYVKGNKDVRILDLAAGTGLVAEQVRSINKFFSEIFRIDRISIIAMMKDLK